MGEDHGHGHGDSSASSAQADTLIVTPHWQRGTRGDGAGGCYNTWYIYQSPRCTKQPHARLNSCPLSVEPGTSDRTLDSTCRSVASLINLSSLMLCCSCSRGVGTTAPTSTVQHYPNPSKKIYTKNSNLIVDDARREAQKIVPA